MAPKKASGKTAGKDLYSYASMTINQKQNTLPRRPTLITNLIR